MRARSKSAGLPRSEAFHEPDWAEAFLAFDVDVEGLEGAGRAAAEVFAFEGDAGEFDEALDAASRARGRCDVVGQQQLPAGFEHPDHLGERALVPGYGAQPEGAHHGVEGGVGHVDAARVAFEQRDLGAEFGGTLAGEGRASRG
jgi:hypothetical protein